MADKHAKTEHKDDEDEVRERYVEESEHNEPEEVREENDSEPEKHESSPKGQWYQRIWQWALGNKKFSIPVAAVLLLGLLAALPFTRYALAGLVVKQSFAVTVVDQETGKPVSSAKVMLGGKSAETNAEGKANIKTKVGNAQLKVEKKYYESFSGSVLVPLGKQDKAYQVKLKAQGRAVPITVLNYISKKPAANVTISAEGTEAKTDDQGKTILVVPADKKDVEVTLSGEGFNTVKAKLTVTTDEVPANTFSITPSGKIYFLSNASGKVDIVRSNIDGSERETVLPGTGKEESYDVAMMGNADWKYIVLHSKRDGGKNAKLFLFETETKKLTTMDEGEATFYMQGWSEDRFIYLVARNNKNAWDQKQSALKSYHAPSKKITTLVETTAEGDQNTWAYENISNVYVQDKEVAFIKTWYSGKVYSYYPLPDFGQGKKASLVTISADGSQKKTIKSYDDRYVSTKVAGLGDIYILYEEGSTSKVDKYHDGKVEVSSLTADEFENSSQPIYITSPNGRKTLWSDNRDGKNVVQVGDSNGKNGKEIGRSNEYYVRGWFTDDYILLTKKGSEMYVMPADGLDGGLEKSVKVTDFYSPYGYY